MQTNFVNQMPDTAATKAALARLDFVICLDQFMTDTAETAHLFLPITTFLEEEDLVPAYGHHWMQLMQPVAPPLGEARSDLSILQALADRLGFGPGMAGSAGSWIDEAVKPLRGTGLGYGRSRRQAGGSGPPASRRCPGPTGASATPSGGSSSPTRMDDAEPVLPTEAYPLHLVAQATTER